MSLVVREIDAAGDPDLAALRRVYNDAFAEGPTTFPSAEFGRWLADRAEDRGYARHLWAIRTAVSLPVSGLASFVTFPVAGFAGYIAFDRAVRGSGRLRPLVACIEAQIARDFPQARGWYLECDAGGPQTAIFSRVGFREVPVTYRQPALRSRAPHETPVLRLMYKRIGRDGAVGLGRHEFFEAMRWIFRIVYGIPHPGRHDLFLQLAEQALLWPASQCVLEATP